MKNNNKITTREVLNELQKNHNHTWFEELYERNRGWLNDTAIFYRGIKISYKIMFERMKNLAKVLKQYGVTDKSEIPVCMSNTPEFVYILGAVNILGARVNVFSVDFSMDYIAQILEECSTNLMFIEDSKFLACSSVITKSSIEHIVLSSITDSLDNSRNPYESYDSAHGKFCNCKKECKALRADVSEFWDLMKQGEDIEKEIVCNGGLDNEFLVTYSSGSTNLGCPKGIVHTNRSLITIGRCHDPEIQKTASMKNFVIMAFIPTQSNTDIISSISDSFMQGATVALEPIYDKTFFIDALMINRPDYVIATTSFWLYFAKQILCSKDYETIRLPELFILFAVGEPLQINEEKLINRALRKVQAGKKHLPFSVVKIGAAGGDCEHGGLFWTVFRSWQNLKPYNLYHRHEQGLKAFEMVDVAILDKNGNYCKSYEYGRLVANSPCNMKKYKNNPLATQRFFVQDAYGKIWAGCNVYAFIDDTGGIHIKGRIPEKEEKLPAFYIADEILRDRKNILSCEVVKIKGRFVAHIELQPHCRRNTKTIIKSVRYRCQKKFGRETVSNLMYRIRETEESFTLTACGKRNIEALKEEGITRAIPV